MKKVFTCISLLFVANIVLLSSCKKDEKEIDPSRKGELALSFENVVGTQTLQLNTQTYTNALGEAFNVSLFNYYISNISLVNSDGSTYTVPQAESYFLVKEELASTKEITLSNIPEGDYKAINFTIGVDSTRCTMPIEDRTGVLDPADGGQGMYWSWNSGYIFMKMEGTSPQAPVDQTTNDQIFNYHIGGFGGHSSATINNIKTVSLSFGGDVAYVREAKATPPSLHITADVLKVLGGSTNVSFASNPVVMSGAYSVNIANNYQSMFSLEHVHND